MNVKEHELYGPLIAVLTIKLTYMNNETAARPTPIRMRLRRAALSSGERFSELTAHLFSCLKETAGLCSRDGVAGGTL
jgi:hypothetical protein